MGYDIGPKIGIEGEKEFKNALKQVNTSLKTLGTEMKAVTSAYDKGDKSVNALTSQNQVLNKQIDEQKSKLDLLKSKLAESADKYGENDAKTQKWQQAVNLATADLNKMERQLDDNNKELEEAAKESDKAGDEVEKAGKQAKQSGDDAESGGNGWSKLKDGLGKVGEIAGKAMLAMGAAAVAAGGALVAASVSGAAYADDIMTLSDVTGIATDDLQKFRYMSELVDVSEETLHKSMAKNIKSMASAADGSKTTANAYAKLGVSVKNADGSLRNGQDVYWETIDALGKVENETERDAIAMQLLGKSAQELNPLIKAGSETMKQYGDDAEAAGYVLSEKTLEAFGAFDDQLQLLKVNSEGAKNALGTILLPALTQLATDGNELLTQFTSGLNAANGDMGKIGDVIGSTLSSLVNKIIERLPQMVEAGMSIIGALGRGLIDNLPAIIDAAVQILKMLEMGIIDNLPMVISAAMEIISTLVIGIAQLLPELIPAAVEMVLEIVETLIDNVDMLIDAAIEIIIALANGLIQSLPTLIEKAPVIVAKLVAAIIENAPKLIAAALELIITLAKGLISNIGQLISSAGEVVSQVLGALKDGFRGALDVGKGIVDGIWNGIKSGWEWLTNSVKNLATSLLDGVKGALGIHSPSKLFRDEVGAMMAEGIGVGFASQMEKVKKQINESIPTSFGPTELDMPSNKNRAMKPMQKQGQVNQTVIINSPTPLTPSQIARESKNAIRRLAWA